MNLLAETLGVIAQNDVGPDRVAWVGTPQEWTTWANFEEVADTEYDAGFGAQEVASDLMIVGDDWWMTRSEYDGSECWAFHRLPSKPSIMTAIRALTVPQANALFDSNHIGWCDLTALNDADG